jgi:hypothetical protein
MARSPARRTIRFNWGERAAASSILV